MLPLPDSYFVAGIPLGQFRAARAALLPKTMEDGE